jgi:hypothetical protein
MSAVFCEMSNAEPKPLPDIPGKLPDESGLPTPTPSSMSEPTPVDDALLLMLATPTCAALDVSSDA